MLKNINKTFLTIYIGQALSQLTSSILQMAVVWHLISQTNSAGIVALSGIVGFLPQGILGLFIGVYIDRYDRKKIMILSDIVIAAASLMLSIAGFIGEIPIGMIMGVLFIRSIGTAFHVPSLQAVIPLIVPKDELPKYSGYSQTFQSISLLLSPILASFFFAIWKLEYIVMLDVIGAAFGVFTLCLVNIPKLQEKNDAIEIRVVAEMKEGVVALKRANLLNFMLLGALFSIVYIPIFVLYPMMTLTYFNKSEWYAGAVEVIFAVGMLLGSLLLSKTGGGKKQIQAIAISCFAIGISLFLSGKLPQNMFLGFILFSALLGFATPFYQGLQTALFQENIEEEYLGRVMSLSNSLMAVGTPLGIGFSGIVSEKIGIEKFFLYSGVVIIGVAFFYIFIPSIKNYGKDRASEFIL